MSIFVLFRIFVYIYSAIIVSHKKFFSSFILCAIIFILQNVQFTIDSKDNLRLKLCP